MALAEPQVMLASEECARAVASAPLCERFLSLMTSAAVRTDSSQPCTIFASCNGQHAPSFPKRVWGMRAAFKYLLKHSTCMQQATCNGHHATYSPAKCNLPQATRRRTSWIGDATSARALQDEAVVAELLVAFESLVLEDDTSTVLCTPLVIT